MLEMGVGIIVSCVKCRTKSLISGADVYDMPSVPNRKSRLSYKNSVAAHAEQNHPFCER